jgi:hypothetical protein
MAPPKKYSARPNLFSFRCDKDKWGAFTLVARVKGTSPTEIFSGIVNEYIKENQDILSALPLAGNSAPPESGTGGGGYSAEEEAADIAYIEAHRGEPSFPLSEVLRDYEAQHGPFPAI